MVEIYVYYVKFIIFYYIIIDLFIYVDNDGDN